MRRAIPCLLALLALVGGGSALADGDPASDYLITADAYYPYSPHPSSGLKYSLNKMLKRTRANSYGMKIALIANRGDLGAYPDLFGQPQKYAKLLSAEITYGKRRPHLLVVMPNGFGGERLAKGWKRAIAGVTIARKGNTSNALIHAALDAVPKLAAAAGHPLK